MNRATENIYSQKVIYHPAQFDLFNSDARFIVIAAGRRSGKTFTAKRKLVMRALDTPGLYFCSAPTFPQAKAIFWEDLKAYLPDFLRSKAPNESECKIFLKNGSEIRIIGLDRPARFEGIPWTGGIIDETDDLKEEAWQAHIRPALDTIGLNTWAILCGVPEGKGLLFELSKKAATDDNWEFYHWKSSEILSKEVIDAARSDLSPLQFRREYEASWETGSNIVYSDYDSIKNATQKTIDLELPIQWAHDFNYTPLSSCIIQEHEDGNHVVDEIILISAVAKNAALEFVDRYKEHKTKRCYIFGDYSGTAGEKHNQGSDYKIIEQILRSNGWNVTRHCKPNPAIKSRQNSLRAQICNSFGSRNLFVNVKKCRYVDNGLSKTNLMKGSSYQEVEDDYQHITTALGYWAWTRYPIHQGIAATQKGF